MFSSSMNGSIFPVAFYDFTDSSLRHGIERVAQSFGGSLFIVMADVRNYEDPGSPRAGVYPSESLRSFPEEPIDWHRDTRPTNCPLIKNPGTCIHDDDASCTVGLRVLFVAAGNVSLTSTKSIYQSLIRLRYGELKLPQGQLDLLIHAEPYPHRFDPSNPTDLQLLSRIINRHIVMLHIDLQNKPYLAASSIYGREKVFEICTCVFKNFILQIYIKSMNNRLSFLSRQKRNFAFYLRVSTRRDWFRL